MSGDHTKKAEELLMWMEQTLRQNPGGVLSFGWRDVVMGHIELAKAEEMANQTSILSWMANRLHDFTNEIVSDGYLSVKHLKE